MKSPASYTRPAACLCAALLLLLTSSAPASFAQRRRRTTQPRPARPAAPRPSATQTPSAPAAQTPAQAPAAAAQQPQRRAEPDVSPEEMLAADSYGVYAEVRRLGTLAEAEEIKTAVSSLGLLGGAEAGAFTDLHRFVIDNAEPLGEARVVVTFMPARAGLPKALVAIELATPEAAAAFEPKLRRFVGEQVRGVKKAMGIAPNEAEPPAGSRPEARQRGGARQRGEERSAAAGGFVLKRMGRRLIASDTAFTLKALRGEEGATRLADSPRFQSVRARFAGDSLFVYVDTNIAQQGMALQSQEAYEAQLAAAVQPAATAPPPDGMLAGVDVGTTTPETAAQTQETAPEDPERQQADTTAEPEPSAEPSPDVVEDVTGPAAAAALEAGGEALAEATPPPPPSEEELAVRGMSGVLRSFWGGIPRIPGSFAIGAGLSGGSVSVRVGIENTPDGTLALIPFLPNLVSGPPVTADTALVAPADSEIFFAASLDWTQVYNSTLGAASVNPATLAAGFGGEGRESEEGKGPRPPNADEAVAAVEKLFGFKFREDVLPSLGHEVAFSMPMFTGDFGLGGRPRRARAGSKEEKEEAERDAAPGFVFIASLNNPEKMRELLPRVLVALGFVSHGALRGVSEKRHGVEIRALGSTNDLCYAIVNSFLVAGEPKAVRHAVDSLEARRTLAASNAYRDSTAWQAKQKLAHVYVSDAVVKALVDSTKRRSGASTDPSVVGLLAQLQAAEMAPASYEATNGGDLVMHEIRLPVSLVKSYVVAMSIAVKDAPVIGGEFRAAAALRHIAYAESAYRDERKKGRYATLEELTAEKLVEKEMFEDLGYKVELNASGDKFEISATPTDYGKTGRRSFFIDESGIVRAADRKGQPATADDPEDEP